MRKNKKAFTLVELLVVIAILVVLSAVTIVGYNTFKDRANLQSDEAFITQVNRVISAEKVENANLTIQDEVNALLENDYDLRTASSKTKKSYYGFDGDTKAYCLFSSEDNSLIYSSDSSATGHTIITFTDDGYKINAKTNYTYNEGVLRGNLEVVSDYTVTVNLNLDLIGNLTINGTHLTVNQYGVVDGDGYGNISTVFNKGKMIVTKAAAVNIDGYVDQLEAHNTTVTTTTNGVIRSVIGQEALTFVNNGWVNYCASANTPTTLTNNGYFNGSVADSYTIVKSFTLSTAEDLLKLSAKTQNINAKTTANASGKLPYFIATATTATADADVLTVTLANDIDITRYTYIPLASYNNRNDGAGCSNGLSIKLTGNNHKIIGLRQNFIGAIGANSFVKNLVLNFNYEAVAGGTAEENIFYKNGNQDGNVTAYYLYSYGSNYYMHIGCLANSIVNKTTSTILVENLSVEGKLIFRNQYEAAWYAFAICAGEFNGNDNSQIFHVHNLKVDTNFQFKSLKANGDEIYGNSTAQKAALYGGDFGNGSAFIYVTYDNTTETGLSCKMSSVYTNYLTLLVDASGGGKIRNTLD